MLLDKSVQKLYQNEKLLCDEHYQKQVEKEEMMNFVLLQKRKQNSFDLYDFEQCKMLRLCAVDLCLCAFLSV